MTKDEIILAQQARIEQLREAATLALETIESNAHERRHVRWKLKDSLSITDDLSALRAHDEKLLAPYQWQPIETAPKDGTAVLALIEGSDIPQSVRYRKGGWRICWDDYRIAGLDGPTNWMPITSADTIEKGGV